MTDYEDIIQKINEVKLSKCEDIKCGDVLHYPLQLIGNHNDVIYLLKGIKRILHSIFINDCDITIQGNQPNVVVLYSPHYKKRNDFIANFRNTIKLINDYVLVWPNEKKKFKKIRMEEVILIAKWNGELKKTIKKKGIRVYCIAAIFEAYSVYAMLERYISENRYKIDALLTLCDVHLVDAFFTQIFNTKNKKTVTLQHGVFTSTINPWAIMGSKSKYFLANSRFTVEEANILGYHNMMIITGLYSQIVTGETTNKEVHEIRSIGAFLDGAKESKDDNVRMIRLLIDYCNRFEKKLLLKYHPITDVSVYEYLYQNACNVVVVEKTMNVKDFCNQVDVGITRNSTTLMETLYNNIPSYIFHEDVQWIDVYKNVNMLKFSSIEELHYYIDERSIEEVKQDLILAQKYFLAPGNTRENYCRTFKRIGFHVKEIESESIN